MVAFERTGRWALRVGAIVALLALPVLTLAQEQGGQPIGKPLPLARWIPGDGLSLYFEHEGFDAAADAWKGTATYRMLHDTRLGAMLADMAAQVADRGFQSGNGAPLSGRELVAILSHAADKGIAFGVANGPAGSREPVFAVLVVREAARNAVFMQVLKRIPPLNPPAARRIEGPGGRTIWAGSDPRIRWWLEKGHFVLCYAADPEQNPALDVIEGKAQDASKNANYLALEKFEAGATPVGRFFVDLSALPPMPPRGRELGLDGIRRIEARWGIEGKAIVTSAGVDAPRPRRGLLALFDQPPIKPGTAMSLPVPGADHVLMSIDPVKLADSIMALVKQEDPEAPARIGRFAQRFQQRTGLSPRDDLLAKIGPRMAILPGGGGVGNVMAMWFHPPDFGMVAELKDAREFAATLDRLVAAANRELSSVGGMVPAQPGSSRRPGTDHAEFRRLKAPEHGYILAVPPAVLPTPAGLRPTVLVDAERGLLAVGGTPTAARRALGSLRLEGKASSPVQMPESVIIAQADPSQALPELLVNLPAIVQFIGFTANQQPGSGANPGPPGSRTGPSPFRLEIDPDDIPDAEELRMHLFPSQFSLAADETSIRVSARQAFPLPVLAPSAGMETPVLIALLLPAVQSAREAARRAQCINNLKQMGLALHIHADSKGAFPAAAIVGRDGKPLLSWRVAILPYLEEQALYNEFKLDEPWDSPHNKELIKRLPAVYGCPSRPAPAASGLTYYRVFTGHGALFDLDKPTRLATVTDGLSNTLMVVEATDAVPWTKPDEISFDGQPGMPRIPLYGAGSSHPGGFNALMGDGSVRFLRSTINGQTLRALITRSGGEVLNALDY